MWVESQFHVGRCAIGVRVHRLDADECERTAAMLVWLTLEAMRAGAESGSGRPWHEFVNGLLSKVSERRIIRATLTQFRIPEKFSKGDCVAPVNNPRRRAP